MCRQAEAAKQQELVTYFVFRRDHTDGKDLTGGKALTEAAKVAGRLL